ncbi:MAG: DUF692 domain-containing protein [Legionellales bacterium]|nr:DUF692 domain-containing protein [Legionellales bacterium]
MNSQKAYHGSGLGLRDEHFNALLKAFPIDINFMEIAPENWINAPYKTDDLLEKFVAQVPFVTHGLSLSLGGPEPLNQNFLHEIKSFLDRFNIQTYTEHLTYCSFNGHLYELFPIPFTEEAVKYVSARIRQTQDILERRIGVENASYYCAPGQVMDEVDFINAVLSEANCDLLLDVNNIYVNSINHGYDGKQFIEKLQPTGISYIHIAGHWQKNETIILDTHGDTIIDPVWDLLTCAYQRFGVIPTLLERDNDIPSLHECLIEVKKIKHIQEHIKPREMAYVES